MGTGCVADETPLGVGSETGRGGETPRVTVTLRSAEVSRVTTLRDDSMRGEHAGAAAYAHVTESPIE